MKKEDRSDRRGRLLEVLKREEPIWKDEDHRNSRVELPNGCASFALRARRDSSESSSSLRRIEAASLRDKDWEARFESRRVSRGVSRTALAIAAAYWLLTLVVFFAMQVDGFDMLGEGALLIAGVTVPWSLLVIAMTSSASSAPSGTLLRPFISPIGTFVLFPVVCGGLNAIAIFWLMSAVKRWRQPRG
jgi:hypothetical protein